MSASPLPYRVVTGLTVQQLLLEYLALEGVDRVFGIPGGALGNLINELRIQKDRFTYVVCRQETGAAYLADGYARTSGKPAVVIVTAGPGATNALTGVTNAHYGGVPMLVVTGEVPEAAFGRGYLQEGVDTRLNVDVIYADSSGFSAVITNPLNAQTLVEQALREALAVPHGAAHLSLPNDVAAAPIAGLKDPADPLGPRVPLPILMPNAPANYRAALASADRDAASRTLDLLNAADRPLILLGTGARGALRGPRLESFRALVDKFGIPVITTPDAKGVFPESHPLSLRTFGLAACEWPKHYINPLIVDNTTKVDPTQPPQYDALLVLGSSLGEMATGVWKPWLQPRGALIQVDAAAGAIGRAYPISLGIVADAGAFVDALCARAGEVAPDQAKVHARMDAVAAIKRDFVPFAAPTKRESEATPILPEALMRILGESLPAGSALFLDHANSVGWGVHYLVVDPPTEVMCSLAMAPMGYAAAAVVGGKLGAPDRPCVAVVGDGAFMMNGSEVSTAAQHHVGAVWVVLRDDDLGMVSQGQAVYFPDPKDPNAWLHYYRLGDADLAQFARGLGADAVDVHSPDDARRELRRALSDADAKRKPQVLVVHVDTSEGPPYYPM